MSVATELVAKVEKYMAQLKREEKMRHALSRLNKIEMTVDLLRKSGVGKAVKGLSDHKEHGKEASRIVTKWMEMARSSGLVPTSKPSTSEETVQNRGSAINQESRKRVGSPCVQHSKFPKLDLSLTCSPSTSFPLSVKRVSPKEEKENFNPELMFKAKTDRIKVFAGRRKPQTLIEVPTLASLCQKVLSKNINTIRVTRSVQVEALRPIFDSCSLQQLEQIESQNSGIEMIGNEVWERIFKKSFVGKCPRPGEPYKNAYHRMKKGTDDRLKAVSQRIKTSMSNGELGTQKRTVIAIAMPLTDQRKPIRASAYDKPSAAKCPSKPPVLIPVPARSSTSTIKKAEVKKGPLMAKAMKMFKNKRH